MVAFVYIMFVDMECVLYVALRGVCVQSACCCHGGVLVCVQAVEQLMTQWSIRL